MCPATATNFIGFDGSPYLEAFFAKGQVAPGDGMVGRVGAGVTESAGEKPAVVAG